MSTSGPTSPTIPISRRAFVARSAAAAAGIVVSDTLAPQPLHAVATTATGPFQTMGTRAGEVTESTAIVWTRLTARPTRNNEGKPVAQRTQGEPKRAKGESRVTVPVDQLEGACPGAPGRVRLRYSTREDLADAVTTEPLAANADGDFICEFKLSNLQPGTLYHYSSEPLATDGSPAGTPFRGRFQTAPAPGAPGNLRFCVMTCQGYADRGHPDGHAIYPAMHALNPHFTCLTGDLVYYDANDVVATNERLARYHWERMFSLPRLVHFNSQNSTYWLKDDHDTLSNDSGPSAQLGDLTFAQGQKIFRQQAPMHDDAPPYRTVRWGRDLQVWFTEGRDFRSKNKSPDGPTKTIWGAEQKAWFKRTVAESNATWKILVSPTPLVGPDRANKRDNHSNVGFQNEGDELRSWIRDNTHSNFFVITGDRHWQYHSVHPETGVHEFSAGPASDEHASGSPGENPKVHKFHRVRGGFLSVTLAPPDSKESKSRILFEHRDVNGTVVYSWSSERPV